MFKNIFKPNPAVNSALAEIPARFQQALAFHQTGRLGEAQSMYEEILKIQPRHSDALHLLGLIAAQTNNMQRSKDLIGRAIDINPNNAAFHINYGNVLKELRQFDMALASYDKAIELEANHAGIYYNRGLVLQELRQFDMALASYDKAIELKPDHAEAYYNRGLILQELGQLGAALESYDKAIEFKPGYAEAHYNKSHALLLLGEFDKGWGLYDEWRWKVEELIKARGRKRSFSQKSWLGKEPLAGKTILLYGEQGYGDTIQFCRYVRLVANLGARVILEIQTKSLKGLLADLEGVSQLVVKGDELPDFDFQCSLLSLPLAFKTNIKTIPASARYLSSDAIKIAQWQTRLGEKAKPRIGLAWSGNAGHKNDSNRSFALSSLVKHLPADFQYVSLQKEVRDVDKLALQARPDILNFANELNDFSDTAALCELMDIVISVDTSVAHLAAALGKPTWILLPFTPDWRWLLDRTDTPWYPSARLYRQEKAGDWDGVFARVSADLMRSSRDDPTWRK